MQERTLLETQSALSQSVAELDRRRTALDLTVNGLRAQVRTLSTPLLAMIHELIPPRRIARISLRNTGRSPAKIIATYPYVDGRAMKSGALGSEYAPTLEALRINEKWLKWEFRPSLASGDQFSLVEVLPEQFDASTEERFRTAIGRLAFAVCYCSVADTNCALAQHNDPPTADLACTPSGLSKP